MYLPLKNVKPSNSLWYCNTVVHVHVGKNTLSKNGAKHGQTGQHKKGEKGTTISKQLELQKRLILEFPGEITEHLSVKDLRACERTSKEQQQAVSNLLSSKTVSTHEKQIKQLTNSRAYVHVQANNLVMAIPLPKMQFTININMNMGQAQTSQPTLLSIQDTKTFL